MPFAASTAAGPDEVLSFEIHQVAVSFMSFRRVVNVNEITIFTYMVFPENKKGKHISFVTDHCTSNFPWGDEWFTYCYWYVSEVKWRKVIGGHCDES